MEIAEKALNYFTDHYEEKLDQYRDFLRIPSVSTDPEHKQDMKRAKDFLMAYLREIGFERVESFVTPVHPIIFAEKWLPSEAKTLLVYGHYDVQPPDLLDEWISSPFEPEVRMRTFMPVALRHESASHGRIGCYRCSYKVGRASDQYQNPF